MDGVRIKFNLQARVTPEWAQEWVGSGLDAILYELDCLGDDACKTFHDETKTRRKVKCWRDANCSFSPVGGNYIHSTWYSDVKVNGISGKVVLAVSTDDDVSTENAKWSIRFRPAGATDMDEIAIRDPTGKWRKP